jgi:ABC-type lipoprotein release transport system permease subunit
MWSVFFIPPKLPYPYRTIDHTASARSPLRGTLAVAVVLSRLLRTLLFEIDARDPATFAAVAALLLFVALAACLAPALRASRMDPVGALR